MSTTVKLPDVVKGGPIKPIRHPVPIAQANNPPPCYLYFLRVEKNAAAANVPTRIRWKIDNGATAGADDGAVVTIDGVKYYEFKKPPAYTRLTVDGQGKVTDLMPAGRYVARLYVGGLDDVNAVTAWNSIPMLVIMPEDGVPLS